MRILIIEDDSALCEALKARLCTAGYEVDICTSGSDAPFYVTQGSADLILLDRMLPGIDGMSILSLIRKNNIQTPVIMATAMDAVGNRIEGLDAGADDYIVKPYHVEELMARIRALVRRPAQLCDAETAAYLDLVLDLSQHTLSCGIQSCSLSKRESALLEYFLKNGGKTISRELLISYVWGSDCIVEEGNLDNYIHFLRKRLKSLNSSAVLKTVHGVGYRLESAC